MERDDLAREIIAVDRERGRRSFARFVRMAWPIVEPNPLRWGWHLDAVTEHLEAVSLGQIRDLVINQPPGTSKSLIVSTLWGAWDWIQNPTRRTIASTYGQDLSEKNAKLQRDLILSDWYQARWGDLVRIGKDDVAKVRNFTLVSGGWRFSTSVGGPATGRHADILLGDDLIKAQDAEGRAAIDAVAIEKANDFWFKTMYTRRADAANTRRVLIAQRLHADDTPGKALEAGYTGLILPMEYDPSRACVTVWPDGKGGKHEFSDPRTEAGELLCPDRFPREVVEQDKKMLGPLTHEAQNNQNPIPAEGLLFKSCGNMRWIKLPDDLRLIITCDAAFKDTKGSDFVSIQCWGYSNRTPGKFYLIDNDTRRLAFGATKRAILAMRERWEKTVPSPIAIYVEDKANGPAIMDDLKATVPGVNPWDPKAASKISRAETVAPLFDAGDVLLPPDAQAPWIASYLDEMRKFPRKKHDDQVDATTMALLILYRPEYRKLIDAYKKI